MDNTFLTKAEEQIMHILWQLENAYVKDLIEQMPEPKPAYNTVSTIVRILETKGFVKHKALGKSHIYYPAIEKKDYTRNYFKGFLKNYFGNSFQQMVSFFANEKDISMHEMEEMMKILQQNMDKKEQTK